MNARHGPPEPTPGPAPESEPGAGTAAVGVDDDADRHAATERYLRLARRYLARSGAAADDLELPTPRPGPSIGELFRRGPRYWGAGLLFAMAGVGSLVPYATRVRLGRALGRCAGALMRRRRRIGQVNLALCFPELGEREREQLMDAHFAAFGIAALEMGAVWWAPPERLSPLARFVGLEHLAGALGHGRGAILLSAHLASMEMGVAHLARIVTSNVVYRPHNDALIDAVIRRGRTRYPGKMLRRNDFRAMIRALRRNEPVWFPPDQDFGRRPSVYARFFGQRAATITVTSRLARLSRAPVLPFHTLRLPGAAGYEVHIGPALEAFPGTDDLADAQRVNDVVEGIIREDPAQYLWVHRRFKTQPAGATSPYAR